jgi:rRNA maturation RNase YbeY
MGAVSFSHIAGLRFSLENRKFLKEFLRILFTKEGKTVSNLSYVFTSDRHLQVINKEFLNHDSYTDIITFDLSEGTEVVGEIYISVERVRENALTYNTTFKREMLRVIFHGGLHLCGYRDKKKSEITTMREKEEEYLRLFDELIKARST